MIIYNTFFRSGESHSVSVDNADPGAWLLADLTCDTSENHIGQCQYSSWELGNCLTGKAVGLTCGLFHLKL